MSATHVSFESWQSGAIPPPGALARYGEVVPDGANRLFTIFEEQTRHRMKMENRVIGGDVRRSWMGLAAGLVVAVTGLVVSGWAIISGHGVEGTILGTADMGALVYAFIFGGNRQLRERLQKYEDTPRRQRK